MKMRGTPSRVEQNQLLDEENEKIPELRTAVLRRQALALGLSIPTPINPVGSEREFTRDTEK